MSTARTVAAGLMVSCAARADVTAKVGSFNTGTGGVGSTVAVTDVGFQPKAVFIWGTERTGTVDSVGAGNTLMWGFAASSTSRRSMAYYSTDAAAKAAYNEWGMETEVISRCTRFGPGCQADAHMDFQSFDSGGFTLVVDDVFPGSFRMHYFAIGGTSITDVETGTLSEPSATGIQTYTTVGAFQPDLVIIVGSESGVSTVNSPSVGWAASSSAQGVVSSFSVDGAATMDTAGYGYGGEVTARLSATGSAAARAAFDSFTTTGFKLNWLEALLTAREYLWLAIKGVSVSVGSVTTLTNTTDTITVSGLAFTPRGVLFASHANAQSTQDTPQATGEFNIGAASGSAAQAAASIRDLDAVADSVVSNAIEHDNVYVNLGTDVVDGAMKLNSLDSAGFTLQMTDADPSGNWVTYLAIGEVVGGGPAGGWYSPGWGALTRERPIWAAETFAGWPLALH